ncbi:hypothetical protein [Herbihabitans rhizosphaerae]|uniref:hypothetical protein n=1 Tax=Herbihabitans rhizosphaerae TaxID=1872711 RepID=UPI00102C4D7F|nr:hypothetical protein [Herbihabitans rhizosphaerae]
MGVPAWLWFVVAAVAAVAGVALLLRERATVTSRNRERRNWAGLRGWQFTEHDQVLPTRWQAGALAYYGLGNARDVVSGTTFTADGRRRVCVFDLDQNGRVSTVIVGVELRREHRVVLELWLPSVPFQRDEMPDLLGPVGQRYAFVSDMTAARPLISENLATAADDLGGDITVVWLEDGWVLAAAPAHTNPVRLERLLRGVGEVADVLDPFDAERDPVDELPPARHDRDNPVD